MPHAFHFRAATELLDAILAGNAPADTQMERYFRAHPKMGGRDRGFVAETVYACLRERRLLAHLAGSDASDAVVAAYLVGQGYSGRAVAEAGFDGDTDYLVRQVRTLDRATLPLAVRVSLPDWLAEKLVTQWGEAETLDLVKALNQPAPVDLRVNSFKAEREAVQARLAQEGFDTVLTPYSPVGLRRAERAPLFNTACFKEGLFEVQDEGSQLLALLLEPKRQEMVVDFCAGAGGKTLAMAARMKNKGKIVACDVLEGRIERAAVRFNRAGVHNVERKALTSERDQWVKRHAGTFDRVLIDAPCTGTGTWRRNPDAKWKLTPQDLEELTQVQRNILDSAWRLVKPGGRLIYATCSLLQEENEAQVAAFLAAHADFKLVPIDTIWREVIGTPGPHSTVIPAERSESRDPCDPSATLNCPMGPGSAPLPRLGRDDSFGSGGGGAMDGTLSLTPAQHGTDGFFVGILERVKVPK
jgi:16S rRNA (cytosine967-C5)-methyltransferase